MTIALIAFREFFEAFIIVGVFWGISQTMQLKKEIEICIATGTGILLSLAVSVITFFLGEKARGILNEENAETLSALLMIASGIFIAYVAVSLHNNIQQHRSKKLMDTKEKMNNLFFKSPLFVTIMILVIREGFEIALFSASTSLFSTFLSNIGGLLIGFMMASFFGLVAFFIYIQFPIQKVFKSTECVMIFFGSVFVQNGITKLAHEVFHFNLNSVFPLRLDLLPSDDSVFGDMIHSIFGIEREFSFFRLAIMTIYFIIFWMVSIKISPRLSKHS